MTPATVILIITVIAGFYMAWNIGANDVANAMGTSVGSGALTLTGAVIVAAVFEFGGSVLVGANVTQTIKSGIVDTAVFLPDGRFGVDGPRLFVLGMVAALIAAGIWLQIATMYGLPVSTTHSIVGAVVGFGITSAGFSAVRWPTMVKITSSWIISPIAGGVVAFLMFQYLRRTILADPDPVARVREHSPYLVALVAMILVLSFVYKGLKNILHNPDWWTVAGSAAVVALAAGTGARLAIARTAPATANPYRYVERTFGWLQIITASFVAFAHGSNDVANAVGPVAAVVHVSRTGTVTGAVPVPEWLLMLGGLGIVVGLATWGYKVIATIGGKITEMAPSRGFSAEFGAAATVLVFSLLGLPISTTHTLVGAVIGVGLAHGIGALNLRVIRNVVNSWIVTVPAAAVMASVIFLALRAVLV
jgi:PiT family inorganic phosphate transporter